jgi:hypothetical protein
MRDTGHNLILAGAVTGGFAVGCHSFLDTRRLFGAGVRVAAIAGSVVLTASGVAILNTFDGCNARKREIESRANA